MEVSAIRLDLAKNVFQAHGADAAGRVVFGKQLRRDKVLAFFASQPAMHSDLKPATLVMMMERASYLSSTISTGSRRWSVSRGSGPSLRG